MQKSFENLLLDPLIPEIEKTQKKLKQQLPPNSPHAQQLHIKLKSLTDLYKKYHDYRYDLNCNKHSKLDKKFVKSSDDIRSSYFSKLGFYKTSHNKIEQSQSSEMEHSQSSETNSNVSCLANSESNSCDKDQNMFLGFSYVNPIDIDDNIPISKTDNTNIKNDINSCSLSSESSDKFCIFYLEHDPRPEITGFECELRKSLYRRSISN